ncbi:MAG: elongation factor G [Deltaproteobacteria bacterium]|nr:elongation factor G [Deltaproteobacteria bacterium]
MKEKPKEEKYLRELRNIGIIAHIDAGKTTLTERMLFYAKRIHRMGEVHDGNATMDYLPEEQERGITISSACSSFSWEGKTVNLIDTPGHVDFTVEVDRSLRVLDGAVGVFCAVGGVEPQSETVWRQSKKYHVPKLAFVNKMDRPGADFWTVLESMREKLGVVPLPLFVPLGQGAEFRGVIDLFAREKLLFDAETQGNVISRLALDDDEAALAETWRDKAVEILADRDEVILESYLAGESVPVERLDACIRAATLDESIVPVFVGSALRNAGVQTLMDGIVKYLPSPLDVPLPKGVDPENGEPRSFPLSSRSPLSALCFKISMETGRKLAFLRVYTGQLEAGDLVYNSTQGIEERAARLFVLHAGRRERVDVAKAGQIVAAAGMRATRTADTLCRKDSSILLERIEEYKPVISLGLEARNAEEEEKLEEALDRLLQEDPTLFLERNEDTEQLILSGMGELHLEVIIERLRREQGIDFRAGKPQVVYQETIIRKADAEVEVDRLLGEETHYGRVRVEIEPLRRDGGVEVVLAVDRETLPRGFAEAALSGAQDALQSGVVKGYPMQDVRALVTEVEAGHPKGTDLGTRMASMAAVKKALAQAGPVLMEPIMWLEIFVPDEFVGECIGLLGAKGAKIENMFDRGGQKTIQALTPLRKMFGFSTEIRSATQGRAGMTMRFDRFDVLA